MTGPSGSDPMDELMSQLANLQQAFGSPGAVGGPGVASGIPPVAEVIGSAGGGAVRIHASGDLEFTAVEIDPAVVDRDDVSVLEDLVLAAVRDAAEQLRRAAEANLGEMVGGALSGLSGLFGALGQASPWDDDEDEDDEDDEDQDDDGDVGAEGRLLPAGDEDGVAEGGPDRGSGPSGPAGAGR